MKTILSLVIIFSLLVSCAKEETQSIKIKGQYEIELPLFLKKGDHLHQDASMQYFNEPREFYTIIIDEPSIDFEEMVKNDEYLASTYTPDLVGYANLLKDNLSVAIKDGKYSDFEKTKIDGIEAILMNATGTVDNIDIYYQFGFVKGQKDYYQIVNWTELKRQNDYSEIMENIISSFKETKQKKKIQ